MRKLALAAIAILTFTPVDSDAGDPRNMSECMTSLAAAMESECPRLYAGAEQAPMREQCLSAIASQVESVCKQFFGEGVDFCATCTKGCTDSFPSESDRRKECLTMCLSHSDC